MRVHAFHTPEGRAALEALLARRGCPDFATLADATPIVKAVFEGGEKALRKLVRRFDLEDGAAAGPPLFVSPSEGSSPAVDPAFASAFGLAVRRVERYHRRQIPRGFASQDALGVSFVERPFAQERVGVYAPGGRAFYPSSLIMGVVPATVAGAGEVVVATPPRAWSGSPELRWAARELGVSRVLLAGGAHAIAGLVVVAGCTKVVGPGNKWVAAAKHLVSSVVSVDLPAGPSEVLIVASMPSSAEEKRTAERIAADLLAQAEHDPDAVCLLFATSSRLVARVLREIDRQVAGLSTNGVAKESLAKNGAAFLFRSLSEAARTAREVSAEHVQLFGREAEALADVLAATAGAVFIGEDTPTALGDYVAGTNHVLPTGGAARSFSGLSTRDFFRWGRTVRSPLEATRALAAPAASLARFEGLSGHAASLELRLDKEDRNRTGGAKPSARARGRRGKPA